MLRINQKLSLSFLFFLAVVSAFFFIAPACGDLEEDPVVTEEQDIDDVINGYATDKISHSHKIGDDPCPQDVTSKIKVFCYKTQNQTDCTADSVVITNISTGLTAMFGDKTSATFTSPSDVNEVNLTFTCAIAESFKHTYTLEFYKDGVKVDEEDCVVDVTVVP